MAASLIITLETSLTGKICDGTMSHIRDFTDLKFRWTATWRTVTWAAAAWGEATFTWREKQSLSFSRGDGRRSFF